MIHLFELMSKGIIFFLALAWNLVVFVTSVSLTIIWISFLFGSVFGVVLMLLFFPEGFFLPMGLCIFCVPLE